MAATSFPHFPELPIELRLKIWSDAMPERLIEVFPEFSYSSYTWKVQVKAESIALLGVSQEARAEGLRGYTKFECQPAQRSILAVESEDQGTPDPVKGHLYIDFSRDTIFLQHNNEMPTLEIAMDFLAAHLEKIQVLAVDFEYCAFDLWSYKKLRSHLVNLQEITFVASGATTPSSCQNMRSSLNLLGPDNRHPAFPAFDFRFMFQDLTESYDSLFENYVMFGTRLTRSLVEGFEFRTRLAERELVVGKRCESWEIVSKLPPLD